MAPALERARHPDGQVSEFVLVVLGLEVVRPRVGDRLVHVGGGRSWSDAVVVDHYNLAGLRVVEVHEPGAEHADHHRLDHGQREGGGDGRVDGVPAHGEHLDARRRSHRMIGRHHASGGDRLSLVQIERTSRQVSPRLCHDLASVGLDSSARHDCRPRESLAIGCAAVAHGSTCSWPTGVAAVARRDFRERAFVVP